MSRLHTAQPESATSLVTLTRPMQISAIYRAWNARRAGKTMTLLKVNSPSGGAIPIPEPR